MDIDCTIDSLTSHGSADLLPGIKLPYGRFRITVLDNVTCGDLQIYEIEIVGDVKNSTEAEIELSGPTIYGSLFNPAGSEIVIMSPYYTEVLQGEGMQNDGLLSVDSNGHLHVLPYLHNTGQIEMHGGGCGVDDIFDNDSNSVLTGFGRISTDHMRNKGTIHACRGLLAIDCDTLTTDNGTLKSDVGATLHIEASSADVNNHGTIEVHAAGAVTFNTNLVNEPNAVIKLLGGTLSASKILQSADATFTGFGGITGDVTIDSDGIIRLTGPTNIVGDVTIEDNAELEISNGQVIVTGHTNCNGTIHLKGGRIVPHGGLSGDCNIISEPSDYNNMEDLAFLADTWLWQID